MSPAANARRIASASDVHTFTKLERGAVIASSTRWLNRMLIGRWPCPSVRCSSSEITSAVNDGVRRWCARRVITASVALIDAGSASRDT